MKYRHGFGLCLLVIAPAVLVGQTMQCISRDGPTMWPMPAGSGSGPDRVPDRTGLTNLLSGTFELYLITTEGTEKSQVSRWRLSVVPIDSQYQQRAQFESPAWRHVFAGTRLDLPSPTPADSLRRRRFLRSTDFEMAIQVPTGTLSWNTAPGVGDGGEVFDVAEVTEDGFSGRWVDGGIGMAVMRRGDITVGERARGYYCAFRAR